MSFIEYLNPNDRKSNWTNNDVCKYTQSRDQTHVCNQSSSSCLDKYHGFLITKKMSGCCLRHRCSIMLSRTWRRWRTCNMHVWKRKWILNCGRQGEYPQLIQKLHLRIHLVAGFCQNGCGDVWRALAFHHSSKYPPSYGEVSYLSA